MARPIGRSEILPAWSICGGGPKSAEDLCRPANQWGTGTCSWTRSAIREETRLRGQVGFYTQTAVDGSFVFDRVPPVACRVEGNLHWSVNGPLCSSRSVPIAPAPGEEITLSLGSGGAEVTGRLALDPPATAELRLSLRVELSCGAPAGNQAAATRGQEGL